MAKWTKNDEELLKKLYLIKRKTAPDIARIMSRDKGAVRSKIVRMGLSSTTSNLNCFE